VSKEGAIDRHQASNNGEEENAERMGDPHSTGACPVWKNNNPICLLMGILTTIVMIFEILPSIRDKYLNERERVMMICAHK